MATYRNAGWPTRDRVIPIRLFFLMVEALAAIGAADELTQYYAGVLAHGQIWASAEGRQEITATVARLRALAFPESS